jgi:hypothetical protein
VRTGLFAFLALGCFVLCGLVVAVQDALEWLEHVADRHVRYPKPGCGRCVTARRRLHRS